MMKRGDMNFRSPDQVEAKNILSALSQRQIIELLKVAPSSNLYKEVYANFNNYFPNIKTFGELKNAIEDDGVVSVEGSINKNIGGTKIRVVEVLLLAMEKFNNDIVKDYICRINNIEDLAIVMEMALRLRDQEIISILSTRIILHSLLWTDSQFNSFYSKVLEGLLSGEEEDDDYISSDDNMSEDDIILNVNVKDYDAVYNLLDIIPRYNLEIIGIIATSGSSDLLKYATLKYNEYHNP
ncbi:Hypothetical protein ORPV_348 [Orpheovirus IHUMI-LCC2]|uniref:Uncharacterized protein n=1 Tax=Orpheovirus IHUMI-LCC2 TaxID=2023057 RepID=A0A2I2L3X7_9VIRU|nr:Hypothetical protein ORPV_348 [Orpheovirus IHUMI-LCC2]SNW62252.1 Hypothetical protein ORPV_348 [Orpheovirus IHUMI-LCC2]